MSTFSLFIFIFLLLLSVICRCGSLLLAWIKTSTIRCPPGFHHHHHCHHHHLRHLHHHHHHPHHDNYHEHHRHDHHLQLFTASHPFEQYDLKFRDKFGFEVIIDQPRHHLNDHWLHNTYHIWLVFDYWSSSSSLKITPTTDIYSGLYYTSPEVQEAQLSVQTHFTPKGKKFVFFRCGEAQSTAWTCPSGIFGSHNKIQRSSFIILINNVVVIIIMVRNLAQGKEMLKFHWLLSGESVVWDFTL